MGLSLVGWVSLWLDEECLLGKGSLGMAAMGVTRGHLADN